MGTTTVRRLRDTSELLAIAEPHEPDSIRIVGDARERGIGRHVRAWVVEDSGTVLAVVVVARLAPDRWYASPLLFDAGSAAAIGEIVDRSRARELAGPAEHVAALLPHVERSARPGHLPFIVDLEPLSPGAIARDARVRLATTHDLSALVALYSEFELQRIATRRRLLHYLERTVRDRAIVVIDVDGSMGGACALEFRGTAFDMWSALTVLPEHRGKGLYFPLYNKVRSLTRESGRHNCFTLSRLNKVPLERQLQELGESTVVRDWISVPLRARRVAGEARLRKLLERFEGPLTPRRPLEG